MSCRPLGLVMVGRRPQQHADGDADRNYTPELQSIRYRPPASCRRDSVSNQSRFNVCARTMQIDRRLTQTVWHIPGNAEGRIESHSRQKPEQTHCRFNSCNAGQLSNSSIAPMHYAM